MNFNKNIFMKNFKDKNYSPCIEMLTDEIIRILIESVKKEFKYSNITNLRNVCTKYLQLDKQNIVFKMHELLFNEDYPEKQLLTEPLVLYEKLNGKSNLHI